MTTDYSDEKMNINCNTKNINASFTSNAIEDATMLMDQIKMFVKKKKIPVKPLKHFMVI